jgi:hypothetical protein
MANAIDEINKEIDQTILEMKVLVYSMKTMHLFDDYFLNPLIEVQ